MNRRAPLAISVAIGLMSLSTPASAAAPGTELWARHGGSAGTTELFSALATSPDGSMVFVTGETDAGRGPPPDEDRDYLTIAYDAHSGTQVWSARYDGPASDVDIAHAIAVSPDGSKVFVTGQSAGSGPHDFDFATVAYRAQTGARLWTRRVDGQSNDSFDRDSAVAVGVSPSGGRVFVTGGTTGTGDVGYHFLTRAYDASTGATVWTKQFVGRTGQDDPVALAVDPDGAAVYVTGNSVGNTNHYNFLTVAYGTAAGDRLWTKRFNGPGADNDIVTAIAVSPDGSKVVVTGDTFDASKNRYDYATVAYVTATGARIWDRIYAGPGMPTTPPGRSRSHRTGPRSS